MASVARSTHAWASAAVKAVHDVLQALREGAPPSEMESQLAPAELMDRVTRSAEYARRQGEFLS